MVEVVEERDYFEEEEDCGVAGEEMDKGVVGKERVMGGRRDNNEEEGIGGLLASFLDSISSSMGGASQKKTIFQQQWINAPNPRTYIGSGKVAEIKSAIHALDVETVIFDDERSPG